MRCSFFLSFGFILWIFLSSSPVSASYDSGPGYGVSHSSYPASPIAHGHGQGWGGGQSAGSYYHYHVPLVGQNSHYHPQPPQQSQDHHLYILLPLLLLAALPLLFLPLLPLLLLPLGLSLIALLLPLLMMGGMMMMMMMGGGMMMMPMMRTPGQHYNHNGESRDFGFGFGHLVLNDISLLMSRYARSLDLDSCPERIACEAGSFIFPDNATESGTARTVMNFIVEQAAPKGKARRVLRSYKQAFWTGSKTGNCAQFTCQPTFRIFASSPPPPPSSFPYSNSENLNYNSTSAKFPYADYYNMYGNQNETASHLNYYNYYNSALNANGPSTFPSYVNHPTDKQSGQSGINSQSNLYTGQNYANNYKQKVEPSNNSWKSISNGQIYGVAGDHYENEIRSAKT